jgi:hypothetical protein
MSQERNRLINKIRYAENQTKHWEARLSELRQELAQQLMTEERRRERAYRAAGLETTHD